MIRFQLEFLKCFDQSDDDLSILGHRYRLPMYRNFKTNQYFGFWAKYAQYIIDTMVQQLIIQHKAILAMSSLL